jgi:hypothetical protein
MMGQVCIQCPFDEVVLFLLMNLSDLISYF